MGGGKPLPTAWNRPRNTLRCPSRRSIRSTASATGSRPPGKPVCGRGWKTIWTASPSPRRRTLFRELLAVELEYRRAAGEQPAAADYGPRFPRYGGEIDAAVSGKLPWSAAQPGDRHASLRSLHIVCPHCRNPIEIRDNIPLTKIACPNCGGTFGLADNDAAALETPGGTRRRQKIGL